MSVVSQSLDYSPLVAPVLAVVWGVVAGFGVKVLNKGINAFSARTGVAIDAQHREAFIGGVKTAAGVIETAIDQGLMNVAHVEISNPQILAQAQAVVVALPDAAMALGMTINGTARMIIGAVDTGSRSVATTTVGDVSVTGSTAAVQAAAAMVTPSPVASSAVPIASPIPTPGLGPIPVPVLPVA